MPDRVVIKSLPDGNRWNVTRDDKPVSHYFHRKLLNRLQPAWVEARRELDMPLSPSFRKQTALPKKRGLQQGAGTVAWCAQLTERGSLGREVI